MKKRQSSKRNVKNANSPRKEDPLDVQFYSYHEPILAENVFLHGIIEKNYLDAELREKCLRQIRLNRAEAKGILSRGVIPKKEIEKDILILKKAQNEFSLSFVGDIIEEKESFLNGLNKYSNPSVSLHQNSDFNQFIASLAVNSLREKGFEIEVVIEG